MRRIDAHSNSRRSVPRPSPAARRRGRTGRHRAGAGHASGIERFAFLDDRPETVEGTRHWVPLNQHPHGWLAVRPGRKLRVVVTSAGGLLACAAQPPTGEWVGRGGAHCDQPTGRGRGGAESCRAAHRRHQVRQMPPRRCAAHQSRGPAATACTGPRLQDAPGSWSRCAASRRARPRLHLAARDAPAGASEAEIHCAWPGGEPPHRPRPALRQHRGPGTSTPPCCTTSTRTKPGCAAVAQLASRRGCPQRLR